MVVDVKDLSVRYMVGDFRDIGIKEYFIQKVKRQYKVKEFWAVNEVSFALEKGDFLGIVGTNGAGKSTLLKTISGILRPQKGSYQTDGTIVALLELGTGFDGDLSLRENIFLRGALLGMTEEFMNETCDKILAFAELKEFENRKYKQLSSGMRSRLAFSISCLVNPDILILDEVLAVGDGAFREKSEKKMFEIINGGATTMFVSHSIAQIKRLSNKVLWLDRGKMMGFGPTAEILPKYVAFLQERKELAAQQAAKQAEEELAAKKPKDTITVPAASKKAAKKAATDASAAEKKSAAAAKPAAEKKPAAAKPAAEAKSAPAAADKSAAGQRNPAGKKGKGSNKKKR